MNARLRKVTRNRGQFPSEQAALKVLYLAVRNLQEFRSPAAGIRSSAWKQALQAFTIYFDGRTHPMKPPRSLTQAIGRSRRSPGTSLVMASVESRGAHPCRATRSGMCGIHGIYGGA